VIVTAQSGWVGIGARFAVLYGLELRFCSARTGPHGDPDGLRLKEALRQRLHTSDQPRPTSRPCSPACPGNAGPAGSPRRVARDTRPRLLVDDRYGGAVAACGLAGRSRLTSLGAPFIVRGRWSSMEYDSHNGAVAPTQPCPPRACSHSSTTISRGLHGTHQHGERLECEIEVACDFKSPGCLVIFSCVGRGKIPIVAWAWDHVRFTCGQNPVNRFYCI